MTILIIGCGSIGARHARNLKTLGVGTLLLYDNNKARAEALATEVGGKTFVGYSEVLDTGPDAVVIATPSSLHVEQALDAARRGIAIFMEKPLATSLQGLDELVAVVAEKKIVTMMGQSYRWHEGLLKLKEVVDSGSLGAIKKVSYTLGQYLPDWHPQEDYHKEYAAQKRLGGGTMYTSMSHTLDTVEWLFGAIQKIEGWKDRLGNLEIDVDDTAAISAVTERGVAIEAHNDFLARPAVHRIEVLGEKGSVLADLIAHTIDGKPYAFEPNKRYVEELHYFIQLVNKKEPDPVLDLAHGAHIVKLMTDPQIVDRTLEK